MKKPAYAEVVEALRAAECAMRLMSPHVKGPITPHPFGLVVIEAKQRVARVLARLPEERLA